MYVDVTVPTQLGTHGVMTCWGTFDCPPIVRNRFCDVTVVRTSNNIDWQT